MQLYRYLQLSSLGESFAELNRLVREGVPCSAFGVQFSHKCHIAASLDCPVLYITSSEIGARQAAEEIAELCAKKVVFLKAKNDVLLYKKSFNKESLYSRLTDLNEIKKGADVVVTTFEALLQLFPKEVTSLEIE